MASIACKKGHVRINNEVVKPSREVFPADHITIRKNQIDYVCTVINIPKNRVGAKLVNLYREDKTPASAFQNSEFVKLAQDHYRKKGLGRPTKKDRRDIDFYTQDGWFDDGSEE